MIDCGQLKQNTAVTITLGQLFAFSDSKTLLKDSLGVGSLDPSLIKCTLTKGTTQSTLTLTASGGNNNIVLVNGGMFTLTLTTGNVDTLGDLVLSFENATVGSEIIFPVSFKFSVLPASVFDKLLNSGFNDLSTAQILTALKADSTYRCMMAMLYGKWRDKQGSSGTYEILDPTDNTTVILEITPSANSPQRTVVIKI